MTASRDDLKGQRSVGGRSSRSRSGLGWVTCSTSWPRRARSRSDQSEWRAQVSLTAKSTDGRFDVPLYTVAEAARALGVPAPTFTTWARGYERRPSGRKPVRGDAVVTVFKAAPGRPSVPFVGLAEGLVLAAVRQAGVPLQRVRPALARLSQEIRLSHALASKRLWRVFSDVVRSYLSRITYGSDGYASLIRLPGYGRADVVADPERAFRQPIFTYGVHA